MDEVEEHVYPEVCAICRTMIRPHDNGWVDRSGLNFSSRSGVMPHHHHHPKEN